MDLGRRVPLWYHFGTYRAVWPPARKAGDRRRALPKPALLLTSTRTTGDRSAASVCELVHLRREIGPRDALSPVTPAALPVEPPSPDVHLSELFAARIDVELETTSGFCELRDVEVRVNGVLPFEVPRFRSLAHGSDTVVGVCLDCSRALSVRYHVRHLPLLQHGVERRHVSAHHSIEFDLHRPDLGP